MPSKRTNDSVDKILKELDRQQVDRDVQGSMTERQVDDILRSVGLFETSRSSFGELGPIEQTASEARFSTMMLDDLLGDLPSLLKAKEDAERAERLAREPVPELPPFLDEEAEEEPKPAPEPPKPPQPPEPKPDLADSNGLGDTTRTGIIKNFLQKMASNEATTGSLSEGKKEFQRFFGESAAVIPDEKGHLRDPGRKKRGLFGLGRVEDTDEFVPINVSLTGHASGTTEEETEELNYNDIIDDAPAPAKKPGFLARLFGGRQESDELYIPESREEEQAGSGVVLEEDAEDGEEQLSMQLPVDNIRSRYTAGRGNGLDMPPALDLPDEEDLSGEDDGTRPYVLPQEPDLLAGMLPGTSTLEYLQQQDAQNTQNASTIYRKKRTTVEFVPARGPKEPQYEPQVHRMAEPVGEPVMTKEEPRRPEQPAAQPDPSGFTTQIGGDDTDPEDTGFFLKAYAAVRSRHQKSAQAAAPRRDPVTGEVMLDVPAAEKTGSTGEVKLDVPAAVESHTGDVRLDLPATPAPAPAPATPAAPDPTGVVSLNNPAAPGTAQFVQNIEQYINEKPLEEDKPDTRFMEAAQVLTDDNGTPPAKPRKAGLSLNGVPADERTETITTPFVAGPHTTQHSYDKPEDAPAVRKDLERQALELGIGAIVTGVLAGVLIYLGIAAFSSSVPLPAPLATEGGTGPLLTTMLVLLLVSCAFSWRTVLWGAVGLLRSPTADTMPALAAFGALAQLVVFLIWPDLYDPTRFCLVAGSAVLLLCANTVGKALDAQGLRSGFGLISNKNEHVVARRMVESGLVQAATRGLGESRPCVLISRPTELFKGFLTSANARRPSDRNQQQFARMLLTCAVISVVFTLVYHKDAGKAVTAMAALLCLGAPLAGALVSALPAYMMQRSAALVGAVIPGWYDIRQLGRINVIHLSTRDLFPEGSVRLCGIKPVRKEEIDRAISCAASIFAQASPTMQQMFLGMIGENRKLLSQVDDLQTVYGKGYVGWIDGERVLAGNRELMEDYDVKIPSLEYEQRHTVNQRRFVYLAISGKLHSVFQVAYERDPDTAAVLESLRQSGISLVVDCEDFNCDEALLETVYSLPVGTVKVLTAEERAVLEPATAWLPESSGNMLHLGSFASFVGGLEAAAGAAEGERRASLVLSASVLLSAVLGLILSVPALGLTALPLPALILYQVAWAVLALIFPMLQRY